MNSLFCMNFCYWESYVQSSCRVVSQSIQNSNASMIQSVVCSCFNATKASFCMNIWQSLKHGSTTLLLSLISSQLNEQQQVKGVKATKDTNINRQGFSLCILGRARYLFIDYLEKGRTIDSEYYIGLLVCLEEEIAKKTTTDEEEKSALSPRQCTRSQVNRNDGITTWIVLWIASALTLFSRSGL